MIKIETVLDILKERWPFREIVDQGHYHYNYSEVVFDSISYDSRKVKRRHSFFLQKALLLKKIPPICYKSGLSLVCRRKGLRGWYPRHRCERYQKKP